MRDIQAPLPYKGDGMREYVVQCAGYGHQSAGIKAMHQFAHDLQARGFVVHLATDGVRPGNTVPTLTDAQAAEYCQRDDVVTVYPERIPGNPFGAKHVARWCLSFPGSEQGDLVYHPSEMVFSYTHLLDSHMNGNRVDGYLYLPTVEPDLFFDDDRPRTLVAFYEGKGSNRGQLDTTGMVHIRRQPNWPETRAELAEILRACRVFYCFDNFSAMTIEAPLCGCPCVIIPSGFFPKDDYIASETGLNGIAIGLGADELARATATIPTLKSLYGGLFDQYQVQLDQFIAITQARQ